ncbi:MAG: hypothetical protein SFW67_27490 [Myxococcaceae bacterium]|nr:hypothetical protein [Myxococcaceae bacterium]
MREFRFLDDKRKTNGLTPQEEQRWYELAAHLGVDMSQYGQWGADGQWYPYPVGYDPNQGYYDPNQAAAQGWYGQPGAYPPPGYDPNQAYDPSQQAPYDPSQQAPYDPSQQAPYDPSQQAPYDPSQQAPYDPSQQAPYDPSQQGQPAYDPAQYPAAQPYPYQPGAYPPATGYPPPGYPPQPGWYGQQGPYGSPGAYGYPPAPAYGPNQYPPAPAAPVSQPWQQPAAWPTGPAAPAPPPPAVAADEVMEISDDEVSPIPTAPPVSARPATPAPPLNLSVPEDPMGDLRDSLLDDVPDSGVKTSAPAPAAPPPAPINLPPRPLFGGAGFSVPKAPPSTFAAPVKAEPALPKLEATAVSALLPEPIDEVPLVDVSTSGVLSAESATQLEVAAASALEEGVEEASISQVTSIEEVDLALTAPAPSRPSPVTAMDAGAPPVAVLPDLAEEAPRAEAQASEEFIPEVSAILEVPPAEASIPEVSAIPDAAPTIPEVSAIPDAAPIPQMSAILDVPPVEESIPEVSAILDVPPMAAAPAEESIPEVSAIFDVPPVAAAPAEESIPEVSAIFDVPPMAAAPVEESIPEVSAILDVPPMAAAPVEESIPEVSAIVDVPPMAAAPVEESIPEVSAILDVPPMAAAPVEDSIPEASALLDVPPVVGEPPRIAAAPAEEPSFDVSMASESEAPADSNWAEVVQASRAEPITDAAPEELPVIGGELTDEAAVAPRPSAPSAFDALAIPPPGEAGLGAWADEPKTAPELTAPVLPLSPSSPAAASRATEVLASSWDAPIAEAPASEWGSAPQVAPAAPTTEVFASSWEAPVAEAPSAVAPDWDAPAAPVAPTTEVFASSWDDAPAAPPSTEVLASNWPAPAPATEVFASNWEDAPVDVAVDDRAALFGAPAAEELSGRADDQIELASNADFVTPQAPAQDLPTIDVADVSVDTDSFEVESGPAASLATGMVGVSGAGVEEAPIELSNNADFLDAQALTSTGEAWQRSGASIDLPSEENDGEIIQGVVVEEEPPAEPGWDTAVSTAPVVEARVALPVAPPPRAPEPVRAPPAVAPAPTLAPQPPARVMADQLFDRSGTVKSHGPVVLQGDHRVILHTMEGQVKRGALKNPDLGADTLTLEAQGGAVEPIALGRVKAIFFMLAPGARSPAGEGQKVRVTFKDGRQVAGFSRDHAQGGAGFFVIPADNRTNTERIFIYRHGVQSVGIEG